MKMVGFGIVQTPGDQFKSRNCIPHGYEEYSCGARYWISCDASRELNDVRIEGDITKNWFPVGLYKLTEINGEVEENNPCKWNEVPADVKASITEQVDGWIKKIDLYGVMMFEEAEC